MSNIVDLQIPQPSEVAVTDARSMLASVQAFAVSTPAQAVEIQETRKRINAKLKALTEERMTMTRPIDEAKKRIMDHFAPPLKFLADALAECDTRIVAYQRRVEEERKEAQRKADAEREKERKRLEAIGRETRERAEAEQRRRDLEARQARERQQEEERRLAREAEKAREAGDRAAFEAAEREAAESRERAAEEQRERERQAEQARISAETKAESFETRAATTVAHVPTPEPVKVKGVGTRENWQFEIINLADLDRQYLMADEAKIGRLVKAMKGEAQAMLGKGVRVFNAPTVFSRS